jgi:hypothetical protein
MRAMIDLLKRVSPAITEQQANFKENALSAVFY